MLLAGQSSNIISQLRDLSKKLVHIIGKGQNVIPPPLVGLQEYLSSTLEDFQKQLDVIENYDWDFDHYLEEDVPTAVRWHFFDLEIIFNYLAFDVNALFRS